MKTKFFKQGHNKQIPLSHLATITPALTLILTLAQFLNHTHHTTILVANKAIVIAMSISK